MIAIKGFKIKEKILAKRNQSFYLANRDSDNKNVFLKVVESQDFDSTDIIGLRREYNISKNLVHPGIVNGLGLIEFHGGSALVMDEFEGMSLQKMLVNQKIPFRDFLIIGIQLCEALGYLHSQGIIHKDIKPSNILINPKDLSIKIIDFGIASLIPQENITNNNATVLEGTLTYISPEQTGRMNRSLDYRSDLYSLGITFYEILTGVPPFISDDPMELIHAHLAVLAKTPESYNLELPKVISPIILKLLEKSPENRYKSITGLKADLERCLTELDNKGVIPNFEIAQNDISDKLSIPQKLYGREKELGSLLNSFTKASQGNSQVVLVSGSPGIGKSVLIKEMSKPIVENKGFFIRGKFDQFNKNIPYSAIIEAFRELIKVILANDQHVVNEWKRRILNQLGDNGKLITDVLPSLELLIGEQKSVAALPASEALNRFNLVFQNFVKSFSGGPSALVLFLDDLQWADVASIQLLNFLLSDKEKKYLMVVGSYRDNEVQSGHPLYQAIENAQHQENVNHIHLNPLKNQDLKQLLADTFSCAIENTTELCDLIDSKTKRNPFFIYEFIKTLYKKELVYFDYNKRNWQWSIGKIEESNISDNVIQLVTELLFGLEEKTHKLCALASCIGGTFDLKTLALVNEKSIKETAEDLWQAVKEGVIIPITENYRSISNSSLIAEKTTYKFLHDRVQQAAYATIIDERKKEIHLKIGRIFLANRADNEHIRIFDIVGHFNNGINLISDQKEKEQLIHLNIEAGLKAKKSSAFEPAFKYFNVAMQLLPKTPWQASYKLTLSIYNEAAELAYLSVKTKEFEDYTAEILAHSKTDLDALNAYLVRIAYYGSQGDHKKSIENGFEILEKLGVKIPRNPNKLNIVVELIKTKIRLRGKTAEDLFALPKMESEQYKAAMSVLSIVTGPSYIANSNLFVLIVFKMIELSYKYGNNRYSSFGYAVYGIVLAGLMDLAGVKMFVELSKKLLHSYPKDEQFSKVNYCLLSLDFLFSPMKNSQKLMFSNIQKGFDSGDFLYASYSVAYHMFLKVYSNYPLVRLNAELEPLCEKLDSLNQTVGLGWTKSMMQFVDNLTNKHEVNTTLNGTHFDEEVMMKFMVESKNVSGITLMYVVNGMNSFVFDNYKEAIKFFNKATPTIDSLVGTPMVNAHAFYLAMAHVAVYRKASFLEKQKTKSIVNKGIKSYKVWAKYCADNSHSRLHILIAAKAYLNQEYKKAKKHLKKASVYAEENNLIQENAMAKELLAKLAHELNEQIAFTEYIAESRFLYFKWGAIAKVRQLEEKYKLQRIVDKETVKDKFDRNLSTTYSADSLDLQTIIKASQALSSEVQLEELFKKMINIVMENAGATKCTVLLKRDGTWYQEISKEISGDENNLKIDVISFAESNRNKLDLPISVANFVMRTKQSVVIKNDEDASTYANDTYIINHKPNSILCFPFSSKGDDFGIIYLENNLANDAFSEDRIRLLSIISAQMAISIENAFLYKNLEQKVKERTTDLVEKNNELAVEKKKSDTLLLNILPVEIANELKEKGIASAKKHANATVLFADVKGFTTIAESLEPEDLVELLDRYFSRFDEIIVANNLEKIKTIGDAYMAVGGVPGNNKATPKDVVRAGKQILSVAKELENELCKEGLPYFQIRIGVHTGPVVSGIVGKSKFQFDIWGDSVNVAARLEQTSEPGKINISRATFNEVNDEFACTPRGMLPIRNRGEVEMYFVE